MTTINRGDTFTFDAVATLVGDRVAVGCQSASLAGVIAAADKVEIEGTTVRMTGLKGVREDGGVRFTGLPGVSASLTDFLSRANNLVVTPAPAPAFQAGDAVKVVSKTGAGSAHLALYVRDRNGHWNKAGSATSYTDDDWVRRALDGNNSRYRAEYVARAGRVVGAQAQAGPRRDRYDFRPGDHVRVLPGEGTTGAPAGSTFTVQEQVSEPGWTGRQSILVLEEGVGASVVVGDRSVRGLYARRFERI